MMKKKITLVVILCISIFSSCQEDESATNFSEEIMTLETRMVSKEQDVFFAEKMVLAVFAGKDMATEGQLPTTRAEIAHPTSDIKYILSEDGEITMYGINCRPGSYGLGLY
jgi:hypothetical protein